jgi:uncharacterized protein YceK
MISMLIALGVGALLVALYGVVVAVQPRFFIGIGHRWQYRERPEPTREYLAYTRWGGVVVAVLFGLLAGWFIIGAPLSIAADEAKAEAEEAHIDALVARCTELLPILDAAVVETAAGGVGNSTEIEALAADHGLRIEWRTLPGIDHPLGYVFDTTLPPETVVFTLPNRGFGSQCIDLEIQR